MTTRVYLIRHGATQHSTEDRFAGETNVELSAIGRGQVERLAERLASRTIVAAYASPLQRALDTAAIIAAPHALQVQSEPGLREMSHGRWEGHTREEVEGKFPEEYRRWSEDPLSFAPVGGDTGLAVTSRAVPALLSIVEKHPEGEVVVVSHKATIRLIVGYLLGFDARTYRDRLDQSPAALNVLDFKDPLNPRLALFNDTSHYGDDPCLPPLPQRRLSKVWGS